ncbi:RNA-binding protein [Frankia sp. CcI49]|uniref:Ribosome-associated heat shock protein Hsp15 n=1 Tax=Parafrankia irregularis TaxID=795642 RepID=A0A0S4QZ52_9ACTN|nr:MULTISPECIES: S4 domain-containing protein [Frankiaceae]KPM53467.1 RNA-binding protein S4 [Frankia sp. R43]MBE3203372.1 RNA-binding S4 domain-containing protein [Parafrankia sp. CH37]ONH54806.1 RNA-binding protein [Frankia sp. CcI49]CUU60236.1 ribosome-associated heat shock protein Hsp15 [Parafrankia irregularis]
MTSEEGTTRVDIWIWSVRLVKTRTMAGDACRGGHVRLNGERVKPARPVRVGDEVRLRQDGHERVVVVTKVLTKRVGAAVAAECYLDNSPPPPERQPLMAVRDRGTGRPTKRDRRAVERLRNR